MMTVDGYMIKVHLDGDTLTVDPTNKAARTALRGADLATDPTAKSQPLVLRRSDIAGVENKDATRMTNGKLVVHHVDGRRYPLHYRRKHQDDFDRLAAELRGDAKNAPHAPE